MQLPSALRISPRLQALPGYPHNPPVKIPSRSRHCYSSEQIPAPQQLNSKTVALMNRAFFNYGERVRNKF